MTTKVFTVGDSYPNLFDTVKWLGDIPVDNVTGIMVANGSEEGQFTGPLLRTSSQNGSDESTWSWHFDVKDTDTVAVGSFKLCLRLTHENGDIETIDIDTVAKVVECG